MLTFGTAGHIDHGKSTLVQELTSIDPDRLPEEKSRGMTIDLGFAWLQASSGEAVGIVDVPGHKHFIHNVIPGLGGIDAALLVVAADDGWMPQTEEHVHILDLLGVKHGIVALTKVDLIDDPDWLELVENDIDKRLAQTSLVNSPIIRISSKGGSGIQQLKEAIDQLVLKIVPRKDIDKPRLPIDRVFVMKGSGVVVTGTLINGCLSSGTDVIISPSGLTAHIRAIESYKQQANTAQPGSRVALNLSGVKKDELKRGDIVLTTKKQARTSRIIDVEIRLIPQLEGLKNNAELVVYLETRELLGRIILFGVKKIRSQEPALAQIRFNQDVATYIGEHFILRQQSPALTIGGGTILDPFAAKYRISDAEKIIKFLEKRRGFGLEELILSEVDRHKYIEREELLVASRHSSAEIDSLVQKLLKQGRLIATKSYIIAPEHWQEQSKKILEILEREYSLGPLKEGLPQAELQNYLALPREAFNQLIGSLVDEGQIVREEDIIALPQNKLKFERERELKVSKITDIFTQNRSSPPTMRELVKQLPGSEDAIRVMCQRNMLIELSEGVLFDRGHHEKIKGEIMKFLKQNGQISIQDVHSLFGFSRKYTIPLLNYLEKEGIVRREGDMRVLVNRQD